MYYVRHYWRPVRMRLRTMRIFWFKKSRFLNIFGKNISNPEKKNKVVLELHGCSGLVGRKVTEVYSYKKNPQKFLILNLNH